MKKIIKNLSLIAFFFLASCGDEFLDKPPIVGVNSDNFYQTEENALFAVNAAYNALQFELGPAGHFRWFWGDVMSDDSEKGGSGPNDAPELGRLERFEGQVNTLLLESEWSASYQGIYRANVVLENVPDVEMNEFTKARILAEAKFIRAYFNYNLVTIFGGVPLVDHLLAPSEYSIQRNTAEEIWSFIETDLVDAISALPYRSEYSADDLGRATKVQHKDYLRKRICFRKNMLKLNQLLLQLLTLVSII